MFQLVQFMYCMWWKLDAVLKFCKMPNFLQNVPRQVGPLEETIAAIGGRNITRVHQETEKNWSTVQGTDSCEWDLERVWSKVLFDSTSLLDLISIKSLEKTFILFVVEICVQCLLCSEAQETWKVHLKFIYWFSMVIL